MSSIGRTLGGRAEPKSKRGHAFSPADCAGPVYNFGCANKKRCAECGACETPQWRQGPSGPQTLCNACGVRYSRLLRRQRSSRKRQPKGLHANTEQQDTQDVSDTNTDSNSKDGVTIALHPLRGSSEEPLQSKDAAAAGSHQLPLFLPEPAVGHASAFFDTKTAAAAAAWGSGMEDSLVCEAALNLLSMSSGQRLLWSSQSLKAEVEGTKVEDSRAQLSAPQPQQQPVRPVMGGEVLQQLLPLLTQSQLAHLRELCQQFDSLHKDLIAAQAARDAVAKVLEMKQEEAKEADHLATRATKALHQEAFRFSTAGEELPSMVPAGVASVILLGLHASATTAPAAPGSSPRKCLSPKRARLQ